MNDTVTIKGTKSGIILVLDGDAPFESLKDEIAIKFQEASGFLGSSNMGLIVRGRKLSESEERQVIDIINDNSSLKIVCIIDEEADIEKRFASAVSNATEEVEPNIEQAVLSNNNNALIYKGNLRSGQDISCEQNVVILGDVKPGANVVSYGSIFILGELRGNAFAGAGGDRNAVIMSLKLDPLQVRIADAIAISQDADKGPKLRIRKKKPGTSVDEPEVAYICDGHIVKTSYGPGFLRQYNNK
ncbi:septum site-determining protein MinC [Butyrivibrio sp. INlla18]|uniref:septum site-determining protein MinC n=1 Tax=Butyrivibrio sp. INlla18 TaxID=1520806 RepID=UPI00088BFA01|nr:septum site-determining protein MinC [Butyrivibrio sp. INlla18]SDA64434.1 septum site-determining protein MinC [Butyrivibrio sp. INlla18]